MDENIKKVKEILIRYYNNFNNECSDYCINVSSIIDDIYFDIFGEYIE